MSRESSLEQLEAAGKVVALEGNLDMVSEQLRLLPQSHMILIVAPLDEYLRAADSETAFNAQSFIRDVHIASTKRNEVAWKFLRSSPQSKLAFLNGGSVSARTICITRISEQLTNGDIEKAEAIFCDIVKDGVGGLYDERREPKHKTLTGSEDLHHEIYDANFLKRLDFISTQREVEMGHKTPTEHEAYTELSTPPAPSKSFSVLSKPRASFKDVPGEICTPTPARRFITPNPASWTFRNGDDIITTVLTVPEKRVSSPDSGTFGPPLNPRPQSLPNERHSTDAKREESHGDDKTEVMDDELLFPLPPNNEVVYGEACVIDVQCASPLRKSMQQASSVASMYSDDKGFDLVLDSSKYSASAQDLRHNFNESERKYSRDSTFQLLPKKSFVKASETIIKRSLPSSPSPALPRPVSFGSVIRYNDHRSDVEENGHKCHDNNRKQPVFDIVEDLIIHFTDGSPHEIYGSILEYKNGLFPILPSALRRSLPTPPHTAGSDGFDHRQYEEARNLFNLDELPTLELDKQRWASPKKFVNIDRTRQDPPSPAPTPSAIASRQAHKLREFYGSDMDSPIHIQDYFRFFLYTQCPEEIEALDRYKSSLIPDASPFRKPMFSRRRDATSLHQILAVGCEMGTDDAFFAQALEEVEKVGSRKDDNTRSGRLDLRYLIELSMQRFMAQPPSARKDLDPMEHPKLLASMIVPHLEIYLASNTTISFLVLSFHHGHLPIILALRSLFSSDTFKLAGILNALPPDPSSAPIARTATQVLKDDFARRRARRRPHRNSAGTLVGTSSAFSDFCKSDYHLVFPAPVSDVQDFASAIRKGLAVKSPWYIAEPEEPLPIPISTSDAATSTDGILSTNVCPTLIEDSEDKHQSSIHPLMRPSTTQSTSTFHTDVNPAGRCSSTSPQTPPPQPQAPNPNRSTFYEPATPRQSIRLISSPIPTLDPTTYEALSSRTPRASRDTFSILGRNTSLQRSRSFRIAMGGDSGDVDELEMAEEDSEDDEYDRMVMGRHGSTARTRTLSMTKAMSKGMGFGTRRRGNSKKAWKWLGLA